MHTTTLAAPWTLTLTAPDAAAPLAVGTRLDDLSVPGCVHTDLLAAGLIADPYLDLNEDTQHWIGRSDWEYAHRFEADPEDGRRYELVFDGIDTVAEVFVNGISLGRTANMHRTFRFDVTGKLLSGVNELRVAFGDVYRHTAAIVADSGERPNVYPEPFQYVRKMACNFGWDWGPTLVTAGLWKDVRLESWATARLASVRPDASVAADGTGRVRAIIGLDRTDDAALTVSVRCAGQDVVVDVPAGADEVVAELTGLDVELWWPHDMGAQPLELLDIALRSGDEDLDGWQRRVGFRTIDWRVEPDAAGTSFVLSVNGIDTFVRGVNWIPDDCFVATIDRDRYQRRLVQTRDANVNLVRIWGGGIYEKDDFYDLCDELGLLVWQDFPFACSAYPEEPLWDEVEAEARDNVHRLMPHPSLVLWNGNNENIWGYDDWGWQEPLAGRSWGHGFYFDLLPRVVAEVDPGRRYWPGSPWSGNELIHPNDPEHANMHSWEVWNRQDYTVYRADRPRFVSEFGFQGPANWATLERSLSERPLTPDSPGMLHHQKADDGNGKLHRGMAPHLPAVTATDPVTAMDDWHFLTQLNQARAVTFGLDWFRSLRPLCMGSIVWQINDCWPVSSWAAIDGDSRLKPLWYALRDAYAPRLVTVQPITGAAPTLIEAAEQGGLKAVLVNDSMQDWTGTLVVRRVDFDGEILADQRRPVSVAAGSQLSVRLTDEIAAPARPTHEAIAAWIEEGTADTEHRARRFVGLFTEDIDAELDGTGLTVTASAMHGGVQLQVHAATLIRGLTVQADRLDPTATVSDQVIDLLPGESITIDITTTLTADDPRWLTAPVLRCVNDLSVS